MEHELRIHLSHACDRCREIILTMARLSPSIPNGEVLARRLTYKSRAHLVAWLGKHGFPSFEVLRDWVRFLHIVWAWEREGVPLSRQAWSAGSDPKAHRKLVRRVAGRSWVEVRKNTLESWLDQFAEQVGKGIRCTRPSPEAPSRTSLSIRPSRTP